MYKTLGKQNYSRKIHFIDFFFHVKKFAGGYSWEGLYKNLDLENCSAPEALPEPSIFSDNEEKTVAQTAQEFHLALSSIKQVKEIKNDSLVIFKLS